ncbi:MAG: hypothetical protein ACRECP_08075 [Methylocella sp.]
MSGPPSLQGFPGFTELKGTDVWRQSIHVYRRSRKTASSGQCGRAVPAHAAAWAVFYGPAGSAASAIRGPMVCRFLAPFAAVSVVFEPWTIALVRARYMATAISRAVLQIVLGRAIVWATAILIGAA